jgi:hypothetical protein
VREAWLPLRLEHSQAVAAEFGRSSAMEFLGGQTHESVVLFEEGLPGRLGSRQKKGVDLTIAAGLT